MGKSIAQKSDIIFITDGECQVSPEWAGEFRKEKEKLGFSFEGIHRGANVLPGGKYADRHCYARFDLAGLPDLEVEW